LKIIFNYGKDVKIIRIIVIRLNLVINKENIPVKVAVQRSLFLSCENLK